MPGLFFFSKNSDSLCMLKTSKTLGAYWDFKSEEKMNGLT